MDFRSLLDPGSNQELKTTFGDTGPWPRDFNALEYLYRDTAPTGVDWVSPELAGLFGAFIGRDPAARWKKYFDPLTTDLPMYDEVINNPKYHLDKKNRSSKIEMMAPSEYLENLTKLTGRNTTVAQEIRATDPRTVYRYTKAMKRGSQFPIPVLDRLYGEQEGRHRMLAARELGLSDVPVLVIDDYKKMLGLE
jgi:hypothetical protein